MRKKILQNLVIFLAAVAMLAALVFGGRLLYHALSAKPAAEQPQQTTQPTTQAPTEPETTAPTETETTPETTQPETVETTVAETEPETTAPPETEPERVTIDTIPQYFQNDYPNDRYDKGTIANSGSGMTALAMVASYMTDHVYTPDVVADDLADFRGNTIKRMDYGCDLYQLSWRRATNFHDAKRELQAGKVVIAYMNSNSVFGGGNHFVVWTGFNEDGLVTVFDPDRDNYEKKSLTDAFENGFRDGQIVAGYAAAWVFDKSEMPEEPFIYTSEPYAEVCRYEGLELTERELTEIAKLICAEGESEPFEGQQAIAEVILNRLVTDGFPSTVHNVIYAEGQFLGAEKMYRQEPTYTQYKAIDRALNGPYVLPKEVVFFSTGAVNDKVWGKIGVHTFCYRYDYKGE